ncbi:isoaspartyl peptidase/L-asparaginase [bacterium]|jgi:beta-aspartyl-peptidase (threonine type)|nr:isoaspartyl peptidase/L-asparaginase [bacterium]
MNVENHAIVVHGGAGVLDMGTISARRQLAYRAGIREALLAGYSLLEEGGSAVDAVEAAVRSLEDNPLFNAGKGAVLAADGTHYLDAAIMDGKDLSAGAVAGVKRVRNPVVLAREVLNRGEAILLGGEAADEFAGKVGVELTDNSSFTTVHRMKQLQRAIAQGKTALDHEDLFREKKGTVGAVAIDGEGHVAAATSTGGMTNKQPGRIGDSPLIGIGTYAADDTCAISCTGNGEQFIRHHIAGSVSAIIRYSGKTLYSAAELAMKQLPAKAGGFIGISPEGEIVMPFNSLGMIRGWIQSGKEFIAIGRKDGQS